MYTIHAHSVDIKDLPASMLHAAKLHQEYGDLDGLIHAKDDAIERVVGYGFEMLSFWDTPEEVAKHICQDPFSVLNNTIVYEECLKKSTDLLFELLTECTNCRPILSKINIVLTEIDGLLKGLE